MRRFDSTSHSAMSGACEAFSYLLVHGKDRAERRRLFDKLARAPLPSDDRADSEEYLEILAAAIESRAGWKRILDRCKPVKRITYSARSDQ